MTIKAERGVVWPGISILVMPKRKGNGTWYDFRYPAIKKRKRTAWTVDGHVRMCESVWMYASRHDKGVSPLVTHLPLVTVASEELSWSGAHIKALEGLADQQRRSLSSFQTRELLCRLVMIWPRILERSGTHFQHLSFPQHVASGQCGYACLSVRWKMLFFSVIYMLRYIYCIICTERVKVWFVFAQ